MANQEEDGKEKYRHERQRKKELKRQKTQEREKTPVLVVKRWWESVAEAMLNFFTAMPHQWPAWKEKWLVLGKVTKKRLPVILGITWEAIRFLFVLGVLAVILLFIWKLHESLLLRDLNLYDEGVTLLGAKRMAMGEVPYLDFFTIYGPLKFSLLGSAFALFGDSLYVARIFFAVVSLVGFTLTFIFFRRESNVFFAAVFTLFLTFFGKMSMTPLFLVLVALWFSAFLRNPQSRIMPFIGGIAVGFLFLLRIDFGGFTVLSLFFLLLFYSFLEPKFSGSTFASAIGKMGTGFFLIVLPFFLILLQQGALVEFWHQALKFPLIGDYQELRHLPWEEMTKLTEPVDRFTVDFLQFSYYFAWYFWPIPFLAAGVFWISQAITRRFNAQGFIKNTLLGLFAIAGFLYASHRSDFGHVAFLNLLAAIYLLHLILQFRHKWWGLLYIPILFVLILKPANTMLETRERILTAEKVQYSFYPTPFVRTGENDNLDQTLQFFADIDPMEKVFVGVEDTSRVFVNNVMLPFLLKQPVATKYHELHTGIVTTAPVQAEMIDELMDVEYVVLWDLFLCEPNKGCESTGVHLLDDYIKEHFSVIRTFGRYKILQRNGIGVPILNEVPPQNPQ